jgi:O-antigen/teichoic acid export membrane protein
MFRRLMGQSALYAVGNMIARGASYALIPLYTQILTPTEYGLLGIVAAVMNAASLFLMFGLYAAAARLYFDYPAGSERRQLVGVLWCFLILVPAAVLLGCDRIGRFLFDVWLPQIPYDPYIRLAVWSAYLANFSLLPATLLRNQEKPVQLLLLNVSGAAINVGLVLALVLAFRQRVEGIIVAGLLANLVMAVVYSGLMLREVEFRWTPAKMWSALIYSLPFWPHAIAGWALNLSDRILLGRYVPLPQVGLYSLGYQAGQALSVVVEGGNQAWAPFFFRTETEQNHSSVVLRYASYFVALTSGLCLALALLARPALRLLTPPAYWPAASIAVLISLGFLSLAPYYVWANSIMHSKSVAGFPASTLGAGLVNLVLNLWLIPHWGIWAAAFNTIIGYVVLTGLNFILALRVYPLAHEYRRWGKAVILAILVGLLGQWVNSSNIWIEAALRVSLMGVWLAALLALGFLTETERGWVKSWIGSR